MSAPTICRTKGQGGNCCVCYRCSPPHLRELWHTAVNQAVTIGHLRERALDLTPIDFRDGVLHLRAQRAPSSQSTANKLARALGRHWRRSLDITIHETTTNLSRKGFYHYAGKQG